MREIEIMIGSTLSVAFKLAQKEGGASFMFNDAYCVVTPTTDWKTFESWFLNVKLPYTLKDYRKDKLEKLNKI